MASIEETKVTHDTLALYSNLRKITRFSHTCQHWMGEDWPTTGPTRYYMFNTEGSALKWFRTGQLNDGTRAITAEASASGCACRQNATTTIVPLELVQ